MRVVFLPNIKLFRIQKRWILGKDHKMAFWQVALSVSMEEEEEYAKIGTIGLLEICATIIFSDQKWIDKMWSSNFTQWTQSYAFSI